MVPPAEQPVLSLRNVSKRYANVHALNGVDLDLYAGRCHALVGENGAGKSTLIKVIGGLILPDEGTLTVAGEEKRLRNPAEGLKLGISVVPQELIFVPGMSVAENIALGEFDAHGGFVDSRAIVKRSQEVLARLGVDVDCRAPLGAMSPAVQQLTMIARGLSREARILVLDEPTAALSDQEADHLFTVLDDLKAEGIGILYVSHRMDELRRLAEDMTVLRDGQLIESRIGEGVPDDNRLIELMVGRSVERFFSADRKRSAGDKEVLRVEGLHRDGVLHDISFSLHAGEILALTGLMGSGRTEVLRCLVGVDQADFMKLFVDGEETRIRSPRDAQRVGMMLVPEERKAQGLVEMMSVADNISLPSLRKWAKGPFVLDRSRRDDVTAMAAKVGLQASRYGAAAGSLSGGNQQKVVIGKSLIGGTRILLLDEPTRGIDAAVKHEIYALLGSLADQGCAVLVVSSEMLEVLGLADRVIVLRSGAVAGTLTGEQATEHNILQLAMLDGVADSDTSDKAPHGAQIEGSLT